MTEFALVTGASRNIGRAIAERLKADGYSILMLDRIEPEDPTLGEFRQVDLSDPADTGDALAWAVEGRSVTRLVNCAGDRPDGSSRGGRARHLRRADGGQRPLLHPDHAGARAGHEGGGVRPGGQHREPGRPRPCQPDRLLRDQGGPHRAHQDVGERVRIPRDHLQRDRAGSGGYRHVPVRVSGGVGEAGGVPREDPGRTAGRAEPTSPTRRATSSTRGPPSSPVRSCSSAGG